MCARMTFAKVSLVSGCWQLALSPQCGCDISSTVSSMAIMMVSLWYICIYIYIFVCVWILQVSAEAFVDRVVAYLVERIKKERNVDISAEGKEGFLEAVREETRRGIQRLYLNRLSMVCGLFLF